MWSESNVGRKVREVSGVSANDIPVELFESDSPIVIRGLVADWPAVRAALASDRDIDEYLRRFDRGQPVGTFIGDKGMGGRYFYNEDCSGFNYTHGKATLTDVLDVVGQRKMASNSSFVYSGSVSVEGYLPGFREENDVKLGEANPIVSLWVGNQSRIACHFDSPQNLACNVAGHRRFTVFPPEQVSNLYIGPIDMTPAGQAISMVDFASPDYERFPAFKEALAAAEVAELLPGDALLIPSMWWHHVEGFAPLNVLVNYWWTNTPKYMGQGMDALYHSLLSIRDLPSAEKAAWKHLFEHYVFGDADKARAHIPDAAQGVLGPLDSLQARKIRGMLLKKLNR